MSIDKKWFHGAVALAAIVSVIALPMLSHAKRDSLNKVILVTSINNTNQGWNGKACITGQGVQCKSFQLPVGQHVDESLNLPGAGQVMLTGFFTHLAGIGQPVQCSKSFQVGGSDVMTGSIFVNQSSGTYTCQIVVSQ